MNGVWTEIACRLLSVIAVIIGFVNTADGIDCYKCTSINGRTKDCEDVFDTSIKTIDLIQRQCIYGFFKGTHCIKLKGEREDGTRIMVRDCSNADWGSHCGDIRYLYGDKEERIHGCLEACAHDGCNTATHGHPRPSLGLVWAISIIVTLTFALNQIGFYGSGNAAKT